MSSDTVTHHAVTTLLAVHCLAAAGGTGTQTRGCILTLAVTLAAAVAVMVHTVVRAVVSVAVEAMLVALMRSSSLSTRLSSMPVSSTAYRYKLDTTLMVISDHVAAASCTVTISSSGNGGGSVSIDGTSLYELCWCNCATTTKAITVGTPMPNNSVCLRSACTNLT
jgi:hypothetical protein